MTTTDTDAPERIAIDPDYVPDHSQHFGTLVKYIRADLAKPRVKPLVWEDRSLPTRAVFSSTENGYSITQFFFPETYFTLHHRSAYLGQYNTPEAAKAAANAHHAANVLAQLEGET